MNQLPESIKVITLGCSKNVVDSERLMANLRLAGKTVVATSAKKADILIINTCGFINDAKEESIHTILEAVKLKESGRVRKVVVMGCLSQRYMDQLPAEIPEVDNFYGVNDLEKIVEDISREKRMFLPGERFVTTPSHYAYLKISEGCDRTCSFCAIPLIRGKHISTPADDLVKEASKLVRNGASELILLAQDLTWYGLDIYGKRTLAGLVDRLSDIEGVKWLRMHYAYPANFPVDVLDVMARKNNICRYLDIPFQHISDPILKSMRRGNNAEDTFRLIDSIRTKVPGIALRTTLITGYPGESDTHFNELCAFVEKIRFDRLGVFAYSEEEGTRAARFSDNVPAEIKQQRVDEIMARQQEISLANNLAKTGCVLNTIIDRKEGDYYVGRTEFDSPEIDNEVLIPSSFGRLKIGNFYQVMITDADYFDLSGQVVKDV